MTILRLLWAYALPLAGPLIAWVLPRLPLAWLPGKGVLRAGAWLLVAAVAVGGAYVLFSALDDPREQRVAVSEVNAKLLSAQNKALRESIAEKDRILAEREASLATLAADMERLSTAMEAARANSPDPDRVIYPADDPWLLEKRARAAR